MNTKAKPNLATLAGLATLCCLALPSTSAASR